MIDLHAHLDLFPDPGAVSRACMERGLYVLSVTTTPSAWKGTSALTADAPRIRTALGLHPQIAHQRKSELALFEELLPQVRYVGEIGLDGGHEFTGYWREQESVFSRILDLCERAGGRIMSLHSRRAASAVMDSLATHRHAGVPVLHWFSGTAHELERAIELGCWFSVGPAMLSSAKGRALTSRMPRDRILTESDGPFAQIQRQAVHPWDVNKAVEILAQLWAEPFDVASGRLMENFRRLTTSGA